MDQLQPQDLSICSTDTNESKLQNQTTMLFLDLQLHTLFSNSIFFANKV